MGQHRWLGENHRRFSIPPERSVMSRISVFLSALVICHCLITNPIRATEKEHLRRLGGSDKWTPEELAMYLPPACRVKEDKTAHDERKMWENTLGVAFLHLHHYCTGLTFLSRVERGIGDRNYLLNAALKEFRYMQRIPQDNALRPELEYNTGYVLFQLKRYPEALGSLQKTVLLKPDYVQAYLLLSSCYGRIGNATRAAEILRAGLARMPESAALKDALSAITTTESKSGQSRN